MPVIAAGVSARPGTAHALNALYEADRVVHTAGEPEIMRTPFTRDAHAELIAQAILPTLRTAGLCAGLT